MTPTRDRGSRPSEHDHDVERIMRRKSRRSFLTLGLSAAAGLTGWQWLRTRPQEGGAPYPLRRMLEFNERLAEACFNDARLSPTYPRDGSRAARKWC